MNPAIGAFIGVSKQTEMLLMTVLALWVNIFDMAIFEISSNLDQVWNVEIDRAIFNSNAEYVIRMLLSGVVLIRTFTLHLYIAFLIAVFWPVCFGTRPTLMLPWLVVSAIKNLGTGIVSIATGGYTCMIYGPLRPACVRFLLSQIIDLSPSFYMWFVGLSLYCDLKKPESVTKLQVKAVEDQELNVALRRRKVKSMIDEDILRQQFESRSFQKKFLGTSAVEVNEFINRCSYDNLKNKFSRSLDSLLDVLTVQTELLEIEDTEPLDIDSSSTLQQKTAKLLGISMDEIDCIKQNRQTRTDFPVYPVQPQKKIQAISLINSRYESPAKLLPETSLYCPPNKKPIRVTKSELKSAKDIPQMELLPEKEMNVLDLTQNESFESLSKMQTVNQSNNSLFKPNETTDVGLESTNIIAANKLPKNCDKIHQMQDRGNLEEVQVENPTKYKFSNTLSDNSHYLLDEYCFLFNKELMLKKAETSKVVSVYAKMLRPNDLKTFDGKKRRLNAVNNEIDVATALVNRFPENISNKTHNSFKSEEKNNKTNSLRKTKEDILNKKNLKILERNQSLKKKKNPSSDSSNIPVFNRDHRNFEKTKNMINERKNIIDKNRRNWFSQENKLDTIEENKDNASLISNQEIKANSIVSVIQDNETKEKVKSELKLQENIIANADNNNNEEKKILSLFNEEDKNTKKEDKVLLKDEKKNKLTTDEEVKNLKNILLNESNSPHTDNYNISVSAEIERLNKKNLMISSHPKKDIFKSIVNTTNTITVNRAEIINRKNYLRSMDYGIPDPFLSVKHSPAKLTKPQKEAPKIESKILSNKLKTSELSDKLIQIVKEEKNIINTDKIIVKNLFEEKNSKKELFKINNKNEFEFTAVPFKPTSRNKQLEFHFKEKISKTRDYKMEDLFKKKVEKDKKDSKTNEKDKSGFPSYFSNKINRMITDACQIRKKSCKKINLFAKVPTNSNTKQRNKITTVELFRKQTPPKTNIFDITRQLSNGQLEIPPVKCNEQTSTFQKNETSPKPVIDLFQTKESKIKKPVDNTANSKNVSSVVLKSRPASRRSTGKTININKIEEKPIIKEKRNVVAEMHNTDSLINSFMSFKSSESSTEAKSSVSLLAKTEEIKSEAVKNEEVKSEVVKNDKIKSEEITNEERKSEVVKSEEIKSEAIKSEEVKNEEVKSDLIRIEELIDAIKIATKTESPCKINLFKQRSSRSIAALKNSLPTIEESKCCKKLSEQAMEKLMSLTKTDFKATITKATETNKPSGNFNCKKLSEQAMNKLISLTNSCHPSHYNKELATSNESISSDLTVYESCKTLSDYAIDKLLSITSEKSESKTNVEDPSISENKETVDILLDSNENKELNVAPSEAGVSLHLKETSTIFQSPSTCSSEDSKIEDSSSVEFKTTTTNQNSLTAISSVNSIVNDEEVTLSMEEECNALLQDVINNIPLNNDSIESSIASTNNLLLTPELEEKNESGTIIVNGSLNESIFSKQTSTPKDIKNCKWITQDCINIFASSTYPGETTSSNQQDWSFTDNEDEEICAKLIKRANLNNFKNGEGVVQESSNEEVLPVVIEKNNIETPQKREIKLVDLAKNACKSQGNLKIKEETSQNSSVLSNRTEIPLNNEYKANIPIVKIEKECNGTPQHRIKLISSTISNLNKNSKNETLNPRNANIIKVKRESDGSLKNTNIVISSLLYKTSFDSNVPLKEEKLCRGTSQHNVKLISSFKHESSSDTNLRQNDRTPFQSKDDFSIPAKIQKVCRGSSQNYIKLISPSKEAYSKSDNYPHKEAISNILKEYQTVPIIKEEKICKGTSKHRIKLVSSYKKDTPSNVNVFHTEAEYKNSKNENITIIKEEKISEGSLHHSIKLIASSSNNTPNKTIFILKKQSPKSNENIPVSENMKKTNSTQTNLFVNVNTVNGKQNLTVIQKQEDDIRKPEDSEVNIHLKDKTNSNESKINKPKEKSSLKEEAYRNMSVIFNALQDYLENDTEKSVSKKESLKNDSNENFLVDIHSSEILSSLIHKVENSIKEDILSKKSNESKTSFPKYNSNQIDFGCQTSTLSKKILDYPMDLSDRLTRSKSAKSRNTKGYHDLNLQKIAFSMTVNKNCFSRPDSKANNENVSKDEKKESAGNLSSRSSRSYVSIHKERIEKAKNNDTTDTYKSTILPNCSFLEDGYTRLHNLLGIRQENVNTKTRKKVDSSFNF